MADEEDADVQPSPSNMVPPVITVSIPANPPAAPPLPAPSLQLKATNSKVLQPEVVASRIRASIQMIHAQKRASSKLTVQSVAPSHTSMTSIAPSVTGGASVRYDMFKDVNQLTLSIHPLVTQFNEFAGITERKTGDLKIDLFGIEAWFRQAKIYMKIGGVRISGQDVKSVFYRMSKDSLSFREFETFIEALADFRKMHPDTLVYRLRLCGNPELESRFVHVTLAEGSADRLVDAFRDSARSVTETFYDTSTKPYEEPICRGGVRRRFHEEQVMFEKDVARIERAKRMESLGGVDNLKSNFIRFAKDRDYYSDGRSMTVTNLIKWMKQAGIIDGTDINSTDIAFLFKKLYSLDQHITVHDVTHFLNELSTWKVGVDDAGTMLRKLRFCKPPARSSVTVVKMEVPEDVVQCFKDTLLQHADDFYEVRELYTPTSADTAYGHTPKSRDRFFQDDIDTKGQKISNVYTKHTKHQNAIAAAAAAAVQAAANKSGQGNMNPDANPEDFDKRRRGTVVEDDSNDNRSKKLYFTQRWSEAYPYGGHEAAYKMVRLDPEIQRYLVNLPVREESADDIHAKARQKQEMKDRLAAKENDNILLRSLRRDTMLYEDITFEEQFKTFSVYQEEDEVAGISRQNGARWILQSHIIDNVQLTTEDVQEIEHKYFKDAKHLPMDRFRAFMDELADKRKIPSAEVLDRLRRCGKPKPEIVAYKSYTESIIGDRRSFRVSILSMDESERNNQKRSGSTDSNISYMESLFEGDPELKVLFAEYSRFGEPTASLLEATPQAPTISPRNIDKWFKQTKLFSQHKLAPAEPNIFYKQLFQHAHHISYIQFYDFLDAICESKKTDLQFYIDALKEAGPPALTTGAPKNPVSEVYDRIKRASIQMNDPITGRRNSKDIELNRDKKSSIRIQKSQIINHLTVPTNLPRTQSRTRNISHSGSRTQIHRSPSTNLPKKGKSSQKIPN